jgi:hypothetical protein
MKPTLRQRWIKWILRQERENRNMWGVAHGWGPVACWAFGGALFAFGVVWSMLRPLDPAFAAIPLFKGLLWVFLGFHFWAQGGWVDLVNAKDHEIQSLRGALDDALMGHELGPSKQTGTPSATEYRESRDELAGELESLPIDKRGEGPETRFREQ